MSVESYSDQTASIVADEQGLTITVAEGLRISATSASPVRLPCVLVDGRPHVVRCPVLNGRTLNRVQFATDPPMGPGEAILDLGQPRPCIPAPNDPVPSPPDARSCNADRRALWDGDRAAWAAQGVTDPDAVFNETVLFRVRAGDPAAIRNIADLLRTPYLKVTRVRFRGDEQVQVTNLGGGPQNLAGWSLREPDHNAVFGLPEVVLQPGQSCTLYTGPPGFNPRGECRAFTSRLPTDPDDIWPDDGGRVVLFYDALALLADDTRYSADPVNQPPAPHLQLIGSVQEVAAPGQTTVPPFGSVRFSYVKPCPPRVLGQPVPSCGDAGLKELVVTSVSRETADVSYDTSTLIIAVPAGLTVQVVGEEQSRCSGSAALTKLVCQAGEGTGTARPFGSPPLRFTTLSPPETPEQPGP